MKSSQNRGGTAAWATGRGAVSPRGQSTGTGAAFGSSESLEMGAISGSSESLGTGAPSEIDQSLMMGSASGSFSSSRYITRRLQNEGNIKISADESLPGLDQLKAQNAELLLALEDLINYGPHMGPVRHDSILHIVAKAKKAKIDQ